MISNILEVVGVIQFPFIHSVRISISPATNIKVPAAIAVAADEARLGPCETSCRVPAPFRHLPFAFLMFCVDTAP